MAKNNAKWNIRLYVYYDPIGMFVYINLNIFIHMQYVYPLTERNQEGYIYKLYES